VGATVSPNRMAPRRAAGKTLRVGIRIDQQFLTTGLSGFPESRIYEQSSYPVANHIGMYPQALEFEPGNATKLRNAYRRSVQLSHPCGHGTDRLCGEDELVMPSPEIMVRITPMSF